MITGPKVLRAIASEGCDQVMRKAERRGMNRKHWLIFSLVQLLGVSLTILFIVVPTSGPLVLGSFLLLPGILILLFLPDSTSSQIALLLSCAVFTNGLLWRSLIQAWTKSKRHAD